MYNKQLYSFENIMSLTLKELMSSSKSKSQVIKSEVMREEIV